MTTNPVLPKGSFSDMFAEGVSAAASAGAEPTGALVNAFKLQLSFQGTVLGWMGISNDWAVLTDNPDHAMVLEKYIGDKGTYYRFKGHSRYLSVSNQAALGFYLWNGATTFKMEGKHLVANHNGQKLSQKAGNNSYLYAWDDYTVLEVTEVPQ